MSQPDIIILTDSSEENVSTSIIILTCRTDLCMALAL